MSTEFKMIKKKNDEESNSKIKMGENFTNGEKRIFRSNNKMFQVK